MLRERKQSNVWKYDSDRQPKSASHGCRRTSASTFSDLSDLCTISRVYASLLQVTFASTTTSPRNSNIVMPVAKRQKIEKEDVSEEPEEAVPSSDDDEASFSGSEQADSEGGSSPDTDDEIAGAMRSKSKKTQKRKRRATDPNTFGSALQSLLNTKAPSALPLSLKPSIARRRNDEKLEAEGKKIIQIERKEKEEKGRIKDVIGGWGGESERALRKVAQRGGMSFASILIMYVDVIAL